MRVGKVSERWEAPGGTHRAGVAEVHRVRELDARAGVHVVDDVPGGPARSGEHGGSSGGERNLLVQLLAQGAGLRTSGIGGTGQLVGADV